MKKIALASFVCIAVSSNVFASEDLIKKALDAGLKPIPSDKKELTKLIFGDKNVTKAQIELGKKLYFEPRISKSGLISCNTCHNLGLGGVDGLKVAIGHKWSLNPHDLNSPTVYNSVFNGSMFWDGRDKDLEAQAQGPIQAEPEMAASKELVEKRIKSIPEYEKEFKKAYGNEVKIDFKLIADTIALFERTLNTPSKYDKFLQGDKKALSKIQQKGLNVFIDKGCAACHNGIGLGGSMQSFNFKDYRFNSGDFKGDKNGLVKTPILRNITSTAPYFHNGGTYSLDEAIVEMGKIQLGIDLSKEEVKEIKAFFKALDGKKPSISYPILPDSTNETPEPIIK